MVKGHRSDPTQLLFGTGREPFAHGRSSHRDANSLACRPPESMTVLKRIPFGLDRLPRSIGLNDPRLPTALAGPDPLRMNTEPLPQVAVPDRQGDHAAQVAAVMDWLISLCGDYARPRRHFIAAYFAFLASRIDAHRGILAENLARYAGLYTPDDWFWSAPRPLPRAWLRGRDGLLPAEIAFWDGTKPLAIELGDRPTPVGLRCKRPVSRSCGSARICWRTRIRSAPCCPPTSTRSGVGRPCPAAHCDGRSHAVCWDRLQRELQHV